MERMKAAVDLLMVFAGLIIYCEIIYSNPNLIPNRLIKACCYALSLILLGFFLARFLLS
jgi:hypothetical protein